ncbi:hypothetical protein V8E36_003751, partial [Tilletia maclaganii]
EKKRDAECTVLANALFRSLSGYLNIQQQIEERKKQAGSTEILGRLRGALKTEKDGAVKANRTLQLHLSQAYPNYRAISDEDILSEEMRHWSSMVATCGTALDLPWWAEYKILQIVDAFDSLVRIKEEISRAALERQRLRDWTVTYRRRVHGWMAGACPTRSTRQVLGRLDALKL